MTTTVRHLARTARMRLVLMGAAAFALGACVALQFDHAGTAVCWLTTLLYAACALTCAAVAFSTSPDQPIDRPRLDVATATVVAASLATLACFGVASVATAVCCVVMYVWGFSPARRTVLVALVLGYPLLLLAALLEAPVLAGSRLRAASGSANVAQALVFMTAVALAWWLARRHVSVVRRVVDWCERRFGHGLSLDSSPPPDGMAADSSRVAEVVGGFALCERIGSGGMGDVYRAEHVGDGSVAAVKLLKRRLIERATHVHRFFREVQALRELDSPHVVKILDWGWSSDDCPFIAMEMLHGESLSEVLSDRGRLDLDEVLWLVDGVARALDAAHRAGIVHRDVKPPNIFLADDRGRARWKVLDFGLSKVCGTRATVTHGRAIGTPSYMSPEQALGEPVDPRTDVFALAAVAYRALTGRPPFAADNALQVLYGVLGRQPPRPSAHAPLPLDVDRVLALGLAKQVEHRLSSAGELAAALRSAADGLLRAELRRRADALLQQQPWGALQSVAPPPQASTQPSTGRDLRATATATATAITPCR